MDIAAAIINATSDKLGFLGGLALLLVCIFCKKEVQLGSVKLPAIDRMGRGLSGCIGVVLIAWAVFVWTGSATIGLISTPPPIGRSELTGSSLLIRGVYAADAQGRLVLQQDRVVRARLSTGREIALFAHSVSSRGSAGLLVFRIDRDTQRFVNVQTSYRSLEPSVRRQKLFDTTVQQGGTYGFSLDRRPHTIKVDRTYWYAIGPDYVTLTIQ